MGTDNNWPLVIASNKSNPIWESGSLNISVKHLIRPYPIRKRAEIDFFGLCCLANHNKKKPSKNASLKACYIWEGCLDNPKGSPGNITPQGREVSLPNNSAFKKFPILTQPKPKGTQGAIKSIMSKKDIFQRFDRITAVTSTPSKPPWKESPPCHI